ncbi:MAG: FtsH protease activity modulator HflK [Gallionellaceae bacterium]|jgi:membrane protease subunit HflK|nr:FtsH protease activity modulator HflK [Gallionellaceae bacterium]
MASNDPQWGNGNKNSGPPDLEALLRDLNKKLGALFSGKKSNPGNNNQGNGGNAGQPKVSAGGGLGLIVIIVLLVWLASGFYIVDAGQRGVVLRFGKYAEPPTEPGPRWHLPFPIETVEVVDLNQVRTVEIGYRNNNVKNEMLQESLMLTDDENIIDIQVAVQYVLKDPADYLFNNRDADEDFVRQIAETAIREVIGKSKMDFALYEGRAQVEAETTQLIQSILDRYNSGIQISKVNLQNAQPPKQVQEAFSDAVRAGQDRERQKNEGQAYANDVVPKATGAAARLLQEADGYKQSVIANAEGDASRFKQILTEYEKAPQVTRERMYLEMMQDMYKNTSKILVDQKNGNNLLYLPLDKLIQSTNPGAAATAPTTAPAAQPAPPQADTSSAAASSRSRDREARP